MKYYIPTKESVGEPVGEAVGSVEEGQLPLDQATVVRAEDEYVAVQSLEVGVAVVDVVVEIEMWLTLVSKKIVLVWSCEIAVCSAGVVVNSKLVADELSPAITENLHKVHVNQGWGSGSLEERAVVLETEGALRLVLVSKVVGFVVGEDWEKEIRRMQSRGSVRAVNFMIAVFCSLDFLGSFEGSVAWMRLSKDLYTWKKY